ncbi:outer membrane beta-barrel protein [Rhodospirillaceae bacterium SYSU D60014]|uniref:outer membrane protein n=1 Tax=Virgifigura deserti TaxID=2268457 RepID=UPI0013C40379
MGVAASVCLGAPSATAADAGPYASVGIGLLSVMDRDGSTGSVSATESYEYGPTINGAVGYTFGNGFRSELEVGYSSVDVDEVKASDGVTSVTLDAGSVDVSILTVTANAFYDFRPDEQFSPYVGGGIGFARIEADDFSQGGYNVEGVSETDLTAFAELGVGIALSDKITVAPAYRFMWVNNGSGGWDDSQAHLFKVGARFAF